MRIALVAVAPLLAAAAAVAAGPLAPTRPSEVVTLAASLDPPGCTGGANGTALDRMVTPEGTYVPIAIPPKKVLVLTEIRWRAQVPANEEVFLTLRPGPEQPGFSGIVLPGGRSDANGRVAGAASLGTGVVIRNPAEVCVRLNGTINAFFPDVSASGYFAKDK
jgi:hypothetical protein